MKLALTSLPVSRLRTELAVAIMDDERRLGRVDDEEIARLIDEARRGFAQDRLKKEILHRLPEGHPVRYLLVFHTKTSKYYNIWETVKIFAARAIDVARDYDLSKILFLLNGPDAGDQVGKAVEGVLLGSYRFDKYKKEKTEDDRAVTIAVDEAEREAAEARLRRYRIVSEEVNRCRDLVNEPGGVVYPEVLARHAKKVAAETKLRCTVLDEKQLAKGGYNGLIAVGKGSAHPPRLIVLSYVPRRKTSHHLALVGKGITFDTGGISLKPPADMWEMKGDMAGGAAVIHAMAAIARLRPATRVTGIVAAAENFPGQNAQRPGDIFVAKNGKSIMVDNTDAEGRLVLTDGLARAGEEKATHIVDIATLTGACVRALGTAVAGIMGSDKALVDAVVRAGQNHGEVFWELPLVEEYKEMLKTYCADINNVGGKYAGAITAGLFLKEFVPEGTPWAHLDIAGPFLLQKKWKYYGEGATGFGLKTMVDLAERFPDLL